MKAGIQLVTVALFLLLTNTLQAQHHHVHDEEHIYHIGFGIGASKFTNEEDIHPGIHVHLLRKINVESNWSLGLGYEGIIEEKWHNGINLLVNYRPLDYLSVNMGPGIVFGEEDGETEFQPGAHMEVVSEFMIAGIHMGPMIGFGLDPHHKHYSLGLHIGIGK